MLFEELIKVSQGSKLLERYIWSCHIVLKCNKKLEKEVLKCSFKFGGGGVEQEQGTEIWVQQRPAEASSGQVQTFQKGCRVARGNHGPHKLAGCHSDMH